MSHYIQILAAVSYVIQHITNHLVEVTRVVANTGNAYSPNLPSIIIAYLGN